MLAKHIVPALGELKVDEVCPVRSANAPSSAVRSTGFARFVETIETCIAQYNASADPFIRAATAESISAEFKR
ncbi:MAG: hypothetical protein OXI15_24890 [Chromatiales bacterium]|nr:hypothetical protein [Chromatiales bacterium]